MDIHLPAEKNLRKGPPHPFDLYRHPPWDRRDIIKADNTSLRTEYFPWNCISRRDSTSAKGFSIHDRDSHTLAPGGRHHHLFAHFLVVGQ